MAEEAKRPSHLQSWHDEENNNEIDGRDRIQRFSVAPPPRNLFTGRTPEAFSYNFAKSINTQNNIIPSPSSPTPVLAHLDQHKEQSSKSLNAPIAPQITFLASQGAHVPSMSSAPQPQSNARIFNTNNDKTPMPKLMNYELTTLENEQEHNKPLWRWQYGINANTAKHLISRSSGYNEDDVSMNFNEMTPEQYRYMIDSQLGENGGDNDEYASSMSPISDNKQEINKNIEAVQFQISTIQPLEEQFKNEPQSQLFSNINNWQQTINNDITQRHLTNKNTNVYEPNQQNRKSPKLITQNDFIPASQTITQSYDYDETYYEPRKIKSFKILEKDNHAYSESENNIERPVSKNEPTIYSIHKESNEQIYEKNTSIKPTIIDEYTSESQPKEWTPIEEPSENVISKKNENRNISTENSVEDMLRTNIFLKNLLSPSKQKSKDLNKQDDNQNDNFKPRPNTNLEKNDDKISKSLESPHQSYNDIKFIRKKPLDMSDVINYVSMKNHFESSKIRPKSQKNLNMPNIPEIPLHFPHSKLGEGNYYNNEHKENTQDKSPIVVKKYKTLQRNNNYIIDQGSKEIRRDLSPPPHDHIQNLPPLGRAGPTLKSYLPPIFV